MVASLREMNLNVLDYDVALEQVAKEQRRPERQGLFGFLSIGFAAAALLTVLGFLLYALFSFRRRFIELGMLRAIGLSAGQMTSFLAWELAFLILTGLVAGTVLGVLVSQIFIPSLQVGAGLEARIPPFLVRSRGRPSSASGCCSASVRGGAGRTGGASDADAHLPGRETGRDSVIMSTEPFIICDNLVKIYKIANLEVVALQGLDLIVAPGELMGIVGASGSGKSTLMNILGGLDRPSAGRVWVDGNDLLKMSDAGAEPLPAVESGVRVAAGGPEPDPLPERGRERGAADDAGGECARLAQARRRPAGDGWAGRAQPSRAGAALRRRAATRGDRRVAGEQPVLAAGR